MIQCQHGFSLDLQRVLDGFVFLGEALDDEVVHEASQQEGTSLEDKCDAVHVQPEAPHFIDETGTT